MKCKSLNKNHRHNFLFEMYLARQEPGVLTWDKKWEEFIFIAKWSWDLLEGELKQDLEIIKEFN